MAPTVVLLAGAWHGSWCWERVVPPLEEAGFRVLTPDLAGMDGAAADMSLARWADEVAGLVSRQPEPVMLVGHSRAGIVISEVAERVPALITTLVYLAAFLVPSGLTMADCLAAQPGGTRAGTGMVPQEDGSALFDPDRVGPVFYNRTEAAWVERAKARLVREPIALFATPLHLTAQRYGAVRRAYVECAFDQAIPLALQRMMQATLPCDPVITLEADHSPFYSAPAELAACLTGLV